MLGDVQWTQITDYNNRSGYLSAKWEFWEIFTFLLFIRTTENPYCKHRGIITLKVQQQQKKKTHGLRWHVSCDLKGKDRTRVKCWTQILLLMMMIHTLCVCLATIYMTWFVEDAMPPPTPFLYLPSVSFHSIVWFLFSDSYRFFSSFFIARYNLDNPAWLWWSRWDRENRILR